MTTRPGYVWDNTALEWVSIGPVALPGSNVFYQSSAPSSPATGDIWVDADDEVPGITSSLNYRWRKIAAGGETSLSGNDTSGLPLAYNPGYEQVYLNGVLQYRGSDYVATTGNTITGLTALVANDTIEVLSFVTAPIGDTYGQAAADSKFVSAVNNGMFLVKPTSVTGGSISANGAVTIGSAVSSVTVNGAFSAAYDAYKIIISGGVASATSVLQMQLGSTATGYYYGGKARNFAGSDLNISAANHTDWYAGEGSVNGIEMNIDVKQPFLTKNTTFTGMFCPPRTDGYWLSMAGYLANTTSYTAFTITPNGGATLTGGTIRIYGYNNGA